ncbi:MAG TPA: hypothetical protein VNS34_11465 [Rhizobiaceae bacterium]|nr:hypothetical protein [Rhizobiaceae bacterium]
MLAGCQSGVEGSRQSGGSGKSAALRTMEQVAIAAHKCWFASKDPAFRPYRFANELNSFSGRPRFLLVPAQHPEARPLLVVQAEGTPARLQAFGPLMQDPLAPRINADVSRWATGDQSCGSAV